MNAAVAELKDRYQFTVETIKKPDVSLLQRMSMPKFPSVEIDGELVFENRSVSPAELETELKRRT